jgi:RsiW-degrading membrane proteinase PrsW (M82 family)
MTFLMVSELVSLQPRFLVPGSYAVVQTGSTSANVLLVAYLPWLVLLPFCGAAGAFLSRRAGGQRPVRVAAGMFPWIALFLLVTFLTLIGQIVPFQHEWIGFVTKLLLVSIPPGIALLLGVIPFLRKARFGGLARTQS